jgi:hypothetical protein
MTDHVHNRVRRGLWDNVFFSILWRYLSHVAMVFICLMGERIPAPSLSDRIVSMTPFVPLISRYNYHIWLLAYVPIAAWFWRIDRNRFVNFMYTGGIISLLRGITVFATSLGPVRGNDINAGANMDALLHSWLAIINPVAALTSSAPHMYLTKDLFFSGHTSSTFLLWLYVRPIRCIGKLALVTHVIVVATVLLSHLHYTIDIIGAWAITFSVFTVVERSGIFTASKN